MKILLVQLGFLGDVVLSTPVISTLKKKYPDAKITILTTPIARDLVINHPQVDSVITFDKRKKQRGFKGVFAMAKILREGDFSIVFSLHKSWRTAFLLLLARIPLRYGFSNASGAFLYSKTANRRKDDHEVLRNLALLTTIGIKAEESELKMSLGLSPESIASAKKSLENLNGKLLIGIAPGSVWATKRWTASGFAAVAQNLSSRGFGIVLVGGPDDLSIASEIENNCGVPILNLVGKVPLIVSSAVISQLRLLISNDSAPLHIASALQIPVVAIFCATVPEFGYTPWMVPSENVGVQDLDCRPCGRHGGNICPRGTHACQLGLAPEVVLAAVDRLLNNFTKNVSTYSVN